MFALKDKFTMWDYINIDCGKDSYLYGSLWDREKSRHISPDNAMSHEGHNNAEI